jgi:hypothetical protein
MFLRNVGSHKIYTVPHPRRPHSLQIILELSVGVMISVITEINNTLIIFENQYIFIYTF